MRVLFLDIDGVLNSAAYLAANPGAFDRSGPNAYVAMFDPAACARLQVVLDVTGAKVVVSSSMRVVHARATLQGFMEARGMRVDVLDVTPYGSYSCRGAEIRAWLDEHPEVTAYAVVDDDSDMDGVRDRLVQTTWEHGLLDAHWMPLVRVLMRPLAFVDRMWVHVFGIPSADEYTLGQIDRGEGRTPHATHERVVLIDGRVAYVPHAQLTEVFPFVSTLSCVSIHGRTT